MNKELYDRKVKIPDSLCNHLSQCFDSVDANSNVEGFNRNQDMRKSGVATYQQIKRIKNWFESYDGTKEELPFILNGGERMEKWCDSVLDFWRKKLDIGKRAKLAGGMENEYISMYDG